MMWFSGGAGLPALQSSLFVCTTDPLGAPCDNGGLLGPQTEGFFVNGLTAVNFGNRPVLTSCWFCGSDMFKNQGGFVYKFAKLNFINSAARTGWNAPFKDIFLDLDGTLTGFVRGTALSHFAFNDWPECRHDTVGTYGYGSVCDGSVQVSVSTAYYGRRIAGRYVIHVPVSS